MAKDRKSSWRAYTAWDYEKELEDLDKASREGWSDDERAAFTALPVFERRPETLSVEDFINLTNLLT